MEASRDNTNLITDGLFRRIRHPIYAFSVLLMLCSAVILPSLPMLAVAAVHVLLMNIKARNEERHLLQSHGEAYARYLARTGRFFPRLGEVAATAPQRRATPASLARDRRVCAAIGGALLAGAGALGASTPAGGTLPGVARDIARRLARLDPERVGPDDVREVLAHVPAPRIIALQGSVALVTMEPFAEFLVAMGYPAAGTRATRATARCRRAASAAAKRSPARSPGTTSAKASCRC